MYTSQLTLHSSCLERRGNSSGRVIIYTGDLVLTQLRIVEKFKNIRLYAVQAAFAQLQEEEAAELWVAAANIRAMANEICSLLGTVPEEEVDVQDR